MAEVSRKKDSYIILDLLIIFQIFEPFLLYVRGFFFPGFLIEGRFHLGSWIVELNNRMEKSEGYREGTAELLSD